LVTIFVFWPRNDYTKIIRKIEVTTQEIKIIIIIFEYVGVKLIQSQVE
jgi:hypothetical protein